MPKKAAAKRKGPTWTPEKLEEAARKRSQTVAIRRYLNALDSAPRNGQRSDPETIRTKLEKLSTETEGKDPISRVRLVQRRLELEEQLAQAENGADWDELEAAFVDQAWEWAQREGISYAALREVGVPVSVLQQAGISR